MAVLGSLGCASGSTAAGPYPQVWARSHNASEVDIYMMCGNQDARWVGMVPAKGAAAFELAGEDGYCPLGLNFFLVVRNQNRGYWTAAVPPATSATIELVIEKYAGLSAARLLN